MELFAVLLCVAGEILFLGALRTLVPKVDADWESHARSRGLALLAVDPIVWTHSLQLSQPHIVLLGCAYLSHYAYPAFYLLYLLVTYGYVIGLDFAKIFFLGNIFYAFCQVAFPVSPPWRFLSLNCDYDSLSPEAGLAEFDRIVGRKVCKNLYLQSHWFDGAMPSGHVLWSALVLTHCAGLLPANGSFAFWVAGCHTFLMAEAAVQFCHHYVLDIFAALVIAYGTGLTYCKIF
jgi:membrane-associated phospholipid phosphatase